MNLQELWSLGKDLYCDKERKLIRDEHRDTQERLTKSRLKDLGTHLRYLAQSLGRDSLTDVAATELTDDNLELVRLHLTTLGKGADVIGNTLSSLKLMRSLAREKGIQVTIAPKVERPTRGRVYKDHGNRKYKKIARTPYGANSSPYGFRYDDWPDHLKREYDEVIKPAFCDPFARPRIGRGRASEGYMKTWLNRAERAFGFLLQQGVKPDDLTFRTPCNIDVMTKYRRFLYRRRGKDTMTTKADLEQWRQLADDLYMDKDTATEISFLIHKEIREFEEVKDKGLLVEKVHPKDLYDVFRKLIGEAQHYEANLHQKYGRKHPEALMAHKWMEAAIWGLMIVTWLREGNVAMATHRHLFRKEDGSWHIRFSKEEMKGRRPKTDQVIDLWEGDSAQADIQYVLDKAAEVRPILVERFRLDHPGEPEPENFFLNSKGRPYKGNVLREFFVSTSVAYLSPEKRISCHDVRTIIPSWLVVREDRDIIYTLQRRLDHAGIQTTERFYLKVERIFNTKLAKLRMDEKAKHRKLLDRLSDKMDRMDVKLQEAFEQISSQLEAGSIDAAGLKQMVKEVLKETERDRQSV